MGAGGGATVLSRQRGEIDNVALSALTKITADNLTAEKGAPQIGAGDAIELLNGDLHDRRGQRERRVVNQHIQPAKSFVDLRQRSVKVFGFADIQRQGQQALPSASICRAPSPAASMAISAIAT